MAKVRFEPARYEVDVEPGTALVDVCEEHPDGEVPFSRYSASRGTCRCKVVRGMESLVNGRPVSRDKATSTFALLRGRQAGRPVAEFVPDDGTSGQLSIVLFDPREYPFVGS